MDIIYKKDTLYVYLSDYEDERMMSNLESRINQIMGLYNIPNLVIKTNEKSYMHFHEFQTRYNSNHRSKAINR